MNVKCYYFDILLLSTAIAYRNRLNSRLMTSNYTQHIVCVLLKIRTACDPHCATATDTSQATGCNVQLATKCDDTCQANYIVDVTTHYCTGIISHIEYILLMREKIVIATRQEGGETNPVYCICARKVIFRQIPAADKCDL